MDDPEEQDDSEELDDGPLTFVERIQSAFDQTADRAEAAGHDEWAKCIDRATNIWEREVERHPRMTNYELALLALDATIVARASGPSSGLAAQWQRVVCQFGPEPGALPEAGLVDQYLKRVGPLRFARSLSLIMLHPANMDRTSNEGKAALDEAASALLLGKAVKGRNAGKSALLAVIDEAAGLLGNKEGVQNTRSRIEEIRQALLGHQDASAPSTTPWRWPTPRETMDAVAAIAAIWRNMEGLFHGSVR